MNGLKPTYMPCRWDLCADPCRALRLCLSAEDLNGRSRKGADRDLSQGCHHLKRRRDLWANSPNHESARPLLQVKAGSAERRRSERCLPILGLIRIYIECNFHYVTARPALVKLGEFPNDARTEIAFFHDEAMPTRARIAHRIRFHVDRMLCVSVAPTPPCERQQRGDDRAFQVGGPQWLVCTVII
jgi:hypothetical protein